jgi:hypothetical protein
MQHINEPYVIEYHGWLGIAALGGHNQWLTCVKRIGAKTDYVWQSHDMSTRDKAIAEVKMHVAQVAWTADYSRADGEWIAHDNAFSAPAFLDAKQLVQYRCWVDWQLAYGKARNDGDGDRQACQIANAAHPAAAPNVSQAVHTYTCTACTAEYSTLEDTLSQCPQCRGKLHHLSPLAVSPM